MIKSLKKQSRVTHAVLCCLGLIPVMVSAKVGVITGPTPIDQGMAIHADDFTIYNSKIAASFAVGTNNYWNMTSGSILDIALVHDGKIGVDLVNDVEFLNDLWTASGSYNNESLLKVPAQNISYKLDDQKVVVTAKTRYWKSGHALPLNVTIEYTLEEDKNYIQLKTIVENPEGNDPYVDMYSGYSLSTLAANMFGPFGYYPDIKVTGIGIGADAEVNEKYGEFVVTYDRNYAVSVQLDQANAYKGSSGYKDVYTKRTIEPGKTYVYTGEILVSDRGETAPVIERYLVKNPEIPAATLRGQIKNSKGDNVESAYVIVSKKGSYRETEKSHGADMLKKDIMQPFVWKISDDQGYFELKLPQDEYQIHVEAKGYTPSNPQQLVLKENSEIDFLVKDGAKALLRAVNEKGDATDFKVTVSGVSSTVKTLGGTVFFSDPVTHTAEFEVAAPDTPITFTYTRASGFDSVPVSVTKTVKPGSALQEQVIIPTLIATKARGWYGMDNHQHSDIGDGATAIEDLYKAQIAAGLEFNVVSDHDSVANNSKMHALTKSGQRLFISSMEVSPGWGHWGILGMDYTKAPISPDLKPGEIIKSAHDMGALIVVNHPYSDYGFFNNRDSVRGGYEEGSDDFDFLELQSTIELTDETNMDKKALDLAMSYWNKGVKKYLTGGSDQHDITSGLYPGIIRMYVYLEGEVTLDQYYAALKNGHSYVTMGPIMTPDAKTLFGSTQNIKAGERFTLKTEVQSVNGLARMDVYNEGKIIASKDFANTKDAVSYTLDTQPAKNTWYSFVAIDGNGKYAVSNPVWVTVANQ